MALYLDLNAWAIQTLSQDFDETLSEDKHFFSTLLGVLQDCALRDLTMICNGKTMAKLGRLFGLSLLTGSLGDIYHALDQKTFPSVLTLR